MFEPGPAEVSVALSSNMAPATIRVAGRVTTHCRRCAPKAVTSSAGAVPTPNAAMVIAPPAASICSVAMSSTEYTNPQGIQPQTIPKAKARDNVLIGKNRRPSGASFGQRSRPRRAAGSRTPPKATSAANNNASPANTRRLRRTTSISSRPMKLPKIPASSKPASEYEAMRPADSSIDRRAAGGQSNLSQSRCRAPPRYHRT